MKEAMSFVWNIKPIETNIHLDKEKCFIMVENIKWSEPKKIMNFNKYVVLYEGDFYVTDDKIILKSDSETKNIKIKNIINMNADNDSIEISKLKGKNILISNFSKLDIYKIILLIKSIQNGTIKNLEKLKK